MSGLNLSDPQGRLFLKPQDGKAGGGEYAAIAKGSTTPWRLGPATVMAIEDSLQRHGWPEGAACETEKTMAANFGVGVRLMRQAFRILQARGACRLQRGRHGGLVVLRPDLDAVAAALADNLRWSGVTSEEIWEARDLLEPLAAREAAKTAQGVVGDRAFLDLVEAANPGLALAIACFNTFPAPRSQEDRGQTLRMRLKPPEAMASNRASHIAWLIGQGVTHERCRAQDRLGSLWDIAGEHDVSLAVAVDAVRILEDAGVVACVKGRSGGVTLKLPDGDAVISAIHGYLAASSMSEDQCVSICHQLNIRAACKAAQTRSPDTLAEIAKAYRRMRAAEGQDVMHAWYQLQKLLHDRAGNRALHLLTRCLAAYCVRTGAVDAALPPAGFLDRMVQATGLMVAAILAGDEAAAAHGQALTRRVLDERTPSLQASAA